MSAKIASVGSSEAILRSELAIASYPLRARYCMKEFREDQDSVSSGIHQDWGPNDDYMYTITGPNDDVVTV